MNNMNNLLKQATNPMYSTVEEAIPQYFEVLDYCKNLQEINGQLTEKELLACDVDISNNKYTEAELFQLIKKMGIISYQVINRSYANCADKGQISTSRDIDIERIFIVHIVSLANHIMTISDYYYANEDVIFHLTETVAEGTKLANILDEALSPHG